MSTTLEQFMGILQNEEGERLEFKEARNHYDFEKLTQYCAALANEGGGRVVLGVTDKRPRRVVGKRGEYTRRRGLDRDTNKALLRQHIDRSAHEGCPLAELNQVLPGLKASQVQNLLRELKRDGKAHPVGKTKAARWYPGPASPKGDDG